MAKVIFSVGEYHPLYNKVVEAEIITRSGGFNKRTIEAITKEEVYHPSDPKGIFIMNQYGDIVGYKERSAFSEKWQGWVKEIIEDDVPQCFEVDIYDFDTITLYTVKHIISRHIYVPIVRRHFKQALYGRPFELIFCKSMNGGCNASNYFFCFCTSILY